VLFADRCKLFGIVLGDRTVLPALFLARKGRLLQDPDGQELADLAAARQEAAAAARDLMAESLRAGRPLGLDRAMVVADENGGHVAEVSFEAALPAEDASP
jgi:hypothetical protein